MTAIILIPDSELSDCGDPGDGDSDGGDADGPEREEYGGR